MAEPEPALKVEDIHKSFGNIKVLKGISLEAYDHNVISILGSSGSGKSTLLRCINLLETPTAGKVYVLGELIKMREHRAGERVAADRKQVERIRSNKLIRLVPAVSFLDMISLEAGSSLILTDSGGVQKEAWFLEKPVVVLREETEWVEIIRSGNGVLSGPDTEKILAWSRKFLDEPPGDFPPIFGDGSAARQILSAICSANWQ